MIIKISINDDVYICSRELQSLNDLQNELLSLEVIMDQNTLLYFIDSEKDKVVLIDDMDLEYGLRDCGNQFKIFVEIKKQENQLLQINNRQRGFTFNKQNTKQSQMIESVESQDSIADIEEMEKYMNDKINAVFMKYYQL